MLPTKFRVNWHSVQEKKRKIDFQDGRHSDHLGFPIRTILAIFDLQVTPKLPTLVWINWFFGSGEEGENRFSRLPHGSHLGFLKGLFFYLQVTLMLPTSFESTGLSVQEKKRKEIDFEDGGNGGHLGFLILTILAVFDQQVTPILATKFRVNWPFGSGEEAKNRISRWTLWRPSWIFDRNDFSKFLTQVTPMLPTKFWVNWHFGSGEKKWKIGFQAGCHNGHLGFPIGTI